MRQSRPLRSLDLLPGGAVAPIGLPSGQARRGMPQTVLVLLLTGTGSHGMSLGDLQIHSRLGQPLNATIAVRLGAGETLTAGCIGPASAGSPPGQVPRPHFTVPEGATPGTYGLRIVSAGALNEPLYELHVVVNCPGAPALRRQYDLLLDLPGDSPRSGAMDPLPLRSDGDSLRAAPDARAQMPAQALAAARPTASRSGTPITAGSRYRVGNGDTLLGIAARITGGTDSLKARAEAIFRANPAAFIRNDINLIKLGSEIVIPVGEPLPGEASPQAPAVAAGTASVPPIAPAPIATAVLREATEVSPATAAEAGRPQVSTPVAASPTAEVVPQTAPAAPPAGRPATVTAGDAAGAGDGDEPGALAAAAAGALFGLLVSALLWFRGRSSLATGTAAGSGSVPEEEPAGPATIRLPAIMARPLEEPGLTVSYSLPDDEHDSLPAEFADEHPATPVPVSSPPPSAGHAPGDDITSELEELFDKTDTGIRRGLETGTVAAMAGEPADIVSGVDFPVGEPTGEEASLNAATVDQPRPGFDPRSDSPTIDLHALAASASGGESGARTLLDALTMLEKDYEEELTASQLLDTAAVRQALGEDDDEPTQVRPRQSGRAR